MPAFTKLTATHERSAWMRGRLAERARHAEPLHQMDPKQVIITPLGRRGQPGNREDRTCDRCGTYVPPTSGPTAFWVLAERPHPWLVVCGGLCRQCAQHEGIPAG